MCKLFRFLFGSAKANPTPPDPNPQPDPQPDPPETDPDPEPDPEPQPPVYTEPFSNPQFALRSTDIADVSLTSGTMHLIRQEDSHEDGLANFDLIADHYGMSPSSLERFNQASEYTTGNELYIPSTEELLFMDCFEKGQNLQTAISLYDNFQTEPNRLIYNAARYRGAGEIGVSYGTRSLEFYSPNTDLIGATESRGLMINNMKEYRVNWGPNLWKCNIFAHDCVYFSGYRPDVMSNAHYITAGSLHRSILFQQLTIDEVTPGCILQLYNGAGSNASHNMVLMSYIHREKIDGSPDGEIWTFRAMGAESERAAVSIRQNAVSLNTSGDYYATISEHDTTGRQFVRFFKPLHKRNEESAV